MSRAVDVINLLLAVIPLILLALAALATILPGTLVFEAEKKLAEIYDLSAIIFESEMAHEIDSLEGCLNDLDRRFRELRIRNNIAEGLLRQIKAAVLGRLTWALLSLIGDMTALRRELEIVIDRRRARAGDDEGIVAQPGGDFVLPVIEPAGFTVEPAGYTFEPTALTASPHGSVVAHAHEDNQPVNASN